MRGSPVIRRPDDAYCLRAGRPLFGAALLCLLLSGCRSPRAWHDDADATARALITAAQQEAVGRTEPIRIESPQQTLRRKLILEQDLPHAAAATLGIHDLAAGDAWDPAAHLGEAADQMPPWEGPVPVRVSFVEALQIGARFGRDYQRAKEDLFATALALDLECDDFRRTFTGALAGLFNSADNSDDRQDGVQGSADLGVSRRFRNGVELSSALAVDLVRLLTQDRSSSFGIHADASISIPLLRGSGRLVVRESLTQAERNLIYAVRTFERFKRSFAVQIASGYLGVLEDLQQVRNQEENYKRIVASTRRARRRADAGEMPEFEFDQAVQDELRARDRWIRARQTHSGSLDNFKTTLGLPADASIDLRQEELETLRARESALTEGASIADYSGEIPPADAPVELQEPARESAGPFEFSPERAVRLALDARLDMRTAVERTEDAARAVMVAADNLRAELTLFADGSAGAGRSIGQAGEDDARLRPERGDYSALLQLDLPLERTAERNAYRNSLVALEQAVRSVQDLEDRIKLDIRNGLRNLLQAREGVLIQAQAVRLARQRVRSTDLFLQAGRAAIRDVLEAEEALLNAQNSLTSALVRYRLGELELQRDLGLLTVTVDGMLSEFNPEDNQP